MITFMHTNLWFHVFLSDTNKLQTIIWELIFKKIISTQLYFAQSAGAIEYSNCFSADRYHPHNECPKYDSNLMLRSQ